MKPNAQRIALMSIIVCALACQNPPSEIETTEDGVSRGTRTTAFPEVGMLLVERADGTSLCTAWLIGARHVVTAAHCFDERDGRVLYIENGEFTDAGLVSVLANGAPDIHQAQTVTLHPDYNAASPEHDIAVVRLATAPTATPMRIANRAPPAGTRVRLVGYGVTELGGDDSGIKRQASFNLDTVENDRISYVGHRNGCSADSGAPLFANSPQGPVVVALHSRRATNDCGEAATRGMGPRLDTHRAWIRGLVNDAGVCNAACNGRQCGPSGCGWDCGTCARGLQCGQGGQCSCPAPSEVHGWSFCSPSCPCSAGQGDCDQDADCRPGLSCVNDVGANYGQSAGLDICEAMAQCPTDAFSWSYCSQGCPCPAGFGDCDTDADCQPGLFCHHNAGADYGQSSGLDICEVPAARTWDLAEDYLIAPGHQNPSGDRHGNANVWSYMSAAPGSLSNPAQYTLLTDYNALTQTYQRWQTDDALLGAPFVQVRHTNVGQSIEVQPGEPEGGNRAVVIRWRSPYNGAVSLEGHIDSNAGLCHQPCNGLTWRLLEGNRTVVSGGLPSGRSVDIPARTFNVTVGELIYLVISSTGPNAFDSAGVDLRIEAQ